MTEIDAVAIFEAYATSKSWRFAYGTKEILNYEMSHKDMTSGEIILMMFPFDERSRMSDQGVLVGWEIGTVLWIGRKYEKTPTTGTVSKLDETMEQKYDRRLLTLRGQMTAMLKAVFCTGDYELKSARVYREINSTNENLDFVVSEITFSDE